MKLALILDTRLCACDTPPTFSGSLAGDRKLTIRITCERCHTAAEFQRFGFGYASLIDPPETQTLKDTP